MKHSNNVLINAGVVCLFIQACWANFPEERFSSLDNQSASNNTGWSDMYSGNSSFRDASSPNDASKLLDTKFNQRDQLLDIPRLCTPNTFIQCEMLNQILVKCNSQGTGQTKVNCAPAKCDPTLQRCNECDPATPPTCQGFIMISCSADGILSKKNCYAGCSNNRCCNDLDNDNYTDCDGDCNDNNASVHPEQTKFFSTPYQGGYDYNCDGKEQPQFDTQAQCTFNLNSCSGDGWSGVPPACGQIGSYVHCERIGSSDKCREEITMKIQACH